MTFDAILPLALFAVAAICTPGPNNMMLASSGATFGFRRTVPHALGVALGLPVMLFAIALGLGEVFRLNPFLRETLRWVGAALLLYIAWRIATSGRAKSGEAARTPFTFLQAAGFQWVNPKAWSMCIGVSAAYIVGAQPVVEAVVAAVVFACVGLVSAHTWSAFGSALRKALSSDARLRIFNVMMGAGVAACAIYLVFDRSF